MKGSNFSENNSLQQTQNSPSGGAPGRVLFAHLPPETQEKIVRLQSFEGEHFSQKLGSSYFQYVLLLIGLIWFVMLFTWANDGLWSNVYAIVLGATTAIAAVIFVYGLYLLIRTQTSRLQPFVHVTPGHFIKTGYKTVEYRDLGQLRGITSEDVLTGGGKYSYALFDFYFDDREELVKVYEEKKAKEWFPKLHDFDSRYKAAVEQQDSTYLKQHNIFLTNLGTDAKSFGGANWHWALPGVLFLIGVPILTAGLMWGANRYNQSISDQQDWEKARKADNAAAFRNYLTAQPNGQYGAEAKQKIDEQYEKAAQKYLEKQKEAKDAPPAQAILALLGHAKTARQPNVQVIFERRNGLTDEAVEKIKKEQFEEDLVSIGNDFSEAKMKEREKSIVTAIELAFKQIIPEDLLAFKLAETRDERLPALLIFYDIIPSGEIYHKTSTRYAAPQSFLGFTINWSCELLAAPGNAAPYRFALNSNPSLFLNTRVYEQKEQDLTKFSTYEVLTGSAFSDFGKHLADEFGLGNDPIKTPETIEAPPRNSSKKR